MAVEVRLFPLLAARAVSRQERREVAYTPGMRAMDLITAEGFTETDAGAIIVFVNGTQSELEGVIKDGDKLEFMIGISGG